MWVLSGGTWSVWAPRARRPCTPESQLQDENPALCYTSLAPQTSSHRALTHGPHSGEGMTSIPFGCEASMNLDFFFGVTPCQLWGRRLGLSLDSRLPLWSHREDPPAVAALCLPSLSFLESLPLAGQGVTPPPRPPTPASRHTYSFPRGAGLFLSLHLSPPKTSRPGFV